MHVCEHQLTRRTVLCASRYILVFTGGYNYSIFYVMKVCWLCLYTTNAGRTCLNLIIPALNYALQHHAVSVHAPIILIAEYLYVSAR